MLVKIASASLCHSDLGALAGSSPLGTSSKPVTLGHEGVGYVQEVGANVKGFKTGDRIGFLYFLDVCCKYRQFEIGRVLTDLALLVFVKAIARTNM